MSAVFAENGPLIPDLESLRRIRNQRHNPLRGLTPARLARALEAFETGMLRDAALLWEAMADRDDTLKSVKPKREKEVSQLAWQVTAKADTGEAGDEHRAILDDFWKSVRVVNAYDRNERGGFRRLVKQMMTSVSFRYAAHHIVWKPERDTLRATFEFVPLWLFENRTGSLRYLREPWAMEGEALAPDEWMVTHGDGLMIACSIGYSAKRNAFNDWLIFSEKFSVPGVLGRTSAKKDTPEGKMMRDAVLAFGHDWQGVLYGDDGIHEKPIEIIQAEGNPSGMPMPAVVERVDRKFAALYRGADLSTMSAADNAVGASLQGKEKEILLSDDAETINEALAEVSRMVIGWHYGSGTEPLAEVGLVAPSSEDEKFYLESAKAAKEMGVRVAKGPFLARLGVQEASGEEEALGDEGSRDKNPETRNQTRADEANAGVAEDAGELMQDLREALAEDMRPLGDALWSAWNAGDFAAAKAALRRISERMPDHVAGESSALSALLEEEMVAAWWDGSSEEISNGDYPGHPFRGNQYTRGRGREGEDKGFKTDVFGRIPGGRKEYLSARDNLSRAKRAIAWAFRNRTGVQGVIWRKGVGRVDLPAGVPGLKADGYDGGKGMAHISAKHQEDVKRMARTLALGKIHVEINEGGSPSENERLIIRGRDKAVIVQNPNDPHAWILTHYNDRRL